MAANVCDASKSCSILNPFLILNTDENKDLKFVNNHLLFSMPIIALEMINRSYDLLEFRIKIIIGKLHGQFILIKVVRNNLSFQSLVKNAYVSNTYVY